MLFYVQQPLLKFVCKITAVYSIEHKHRIIRLRRYKTVLLHRFTKTHPSVAKASRKTNVSYKIKLLMTKTYQMLAQSGNCIHIVSKNSICRYEIILMINQHHRYAQTMYFQQQL
ncbi:hypothetical protein D3C80_1219540 [compost metagenome]